MIVKGGARSSTGFFSYHLLKTEDNERVEVKDLRGFTADTVPDAFLELSMIAQGTNVRNSFYHLSASPDPKEPNLTPEQWQRTADVLEEQLGFAEQPRMIIEHEKNGRIHRHFVYGRIDPDTMTAISDSHNYQAHDRARYQLEQEFNHSRTAETPEPSQRKSREFAEWENWRGAESGIDPKEMKAEITELWQQSDGGRAFQAAIEEKGYLLAKGDRRDFVLVDPTGDIHSLARRIDGAKAADIRAKMGDLDRDSLMGAKEASAWMKAQPQDESGGQGAVASGQQQTEPEQWVNPKLAVLTKFAHDHPAIAPPESSGYILPMSAQDAAVIHAASLSPMSVEEQQTAQHAWNMLEARRAEIPEAELPQTPLDPDKELWQEWLTQERARQQDEPELER